MNQWRSQILVSVGADGMARAYKGALGAETLAGCRGRAPGQRSEGRISSLKPKRLAFGRLMEAANLPTFLKFANAENHRYLCRVAIPCLLRKCSTAQVLRLVPSAGAAPRSHVDTNNLQLSKCPSFISLPSSTSQPGPHSPKTLVGSA